MNIELKSNLVIVDGEEVGSVTPDHAFSPSVKLHWKRVEAIEKALSQLRGSSVVEQQSHNLRAEGSTPSPATTHGREPGCPEPENDSGDLAPNVVAWRKQNWPQDAFENLYPESRLNAAELAHLI